MTCIILVIAIGVAVGIQGYLHGEAMYRMGRRHGAELTRLGLYEPKDPP